MAQVSGRIGRTCSVDADRLPWRLRGIVRVLQVIEPTLGGTRRFLEDVFVASEGFHNAIAFATARADGAFFELLKQMQSAGWATYPLDLRREVNARSDIAGVARLCSIIEHFKPDVVHAHSSKAGAIARLAKLWLRRRIPIVYTPNAIASRLGWMYLAIERLLGPQTDVLAAVTQSEKAELLALRIVAERRVRIIVPSIRSDYFVPADREAARGGIGVGDAPLVVGIGRLAPQKGPLGFVDIIGALAARVPDVRAIWVGDGDLRKSMMEKIDAMSLGGRISIAGWRDDVRPYLAACDVFVSSSAYESFGYVTAEAFAMSRPVVASRITGTIDIVTRHRDHVLYLPGDYESAAAAVDAMLGDVTLANEVAAAGRDYVLTTFSPAATRRGLDEAYSAAVAEI
jgi:glycosyltransferase involved in cell wall biosynthesis